MIVCVDYSAREYLADQRSRLGDLYVTAMCSQGAFEQQAANDRRLAQFNASYPSMVRLFDQPPLPVRPAPEAAVIPIRRNV